VTETEAAAAAVARGTKPTTLEDGEALISALKAGDSQAWGRLFDAYYALLCRYAFARLRSREDAEDVSSQVFVNALEAIQRYQYRNRPLLAWLYTIARNLVSERLRRRTPQTADAWNAPVATEIDLAARLDLLNALKALREEQRETVILRFSLGLSIRETAQVMGKSEAAVHSLQVRALQNLRLRVNRS